MMVIVAALEDLFGRVNIKLDRLRSEIQEDNNAEEMLKSRAQPDRVKWELARAEEEMRQACGRLLEQLRRHHDADLEKYTASSNNENVEMSAYFLKGKQNIQASGLAGRVRVEHDLLSRVQFARFRAAAASVQLPPRLESAERANLSSHKSYITPDLILPHSLERIVYAHACTPGSFELVVRNCSAGSKRPQQDFAHKSERMEKTATSGGLRLELCQIDYHNDRIILYLENRNTHEYVLRSYDLTSLRVLRSSPFAYPILRILTHQNDILIYHDFDDENIDDDDVQQQETDQQQSVSSCDSSLIKLLQADLTSSPPRPIKFDDSILRRFYSLDDLNAELILVHGQRGLATVSRGDGRLVRELADLESLVTSNNSPSERARDERFRQDAQPRYEMHALFEYLNLKLFKEFVVVATWSRLCVLDVESLCVYVKTDLYATMGAQNCWYLPNRMFVSKHGQLVFYDSANLLLTFI